MGGVNILSGDESADGGSKKATAPESLLKAKVLKVFRLRGVDTVVDQEVQVTRAQAERLTKNRLIELK